MKEKSKRKPKLTLTLDEARRKWCIEQAQSVKIANADGGYNQAPIIETAQKIYDWVKK